MIILQIMKLIKPEFQIIEPTGYTIDDIYKSIELAGRVSHRSEDKITETSAKDFVGRMLNMKHLATCEFGTIYLYIDYHNPSFGKIIDKYNNNQYSKCIIDNVFPDKAYISSNYRVLVENNWLDDLKYLCEPTEYHYKRYTIKFVLDRAILAEFTRHRKFSFMAESSRYNNYSKNKFNNELTFIEPCWLTSDMKSNLTYLNYVDTLQKIEDTYITLTKNGWKAEEARNILPLCLKTELYMCGFAEDWKKFFELRSKKYGVGNPHPQADELATPLYEEFIKRGYINER